MPKYNWNAKRFNTKFNNLKEALHKIFELHRGMNISVQSAERIQYMTEFALKSSGLDCLLEKNTFMPGQKTDVMCALNIYKNKESYIRGVLNPRGWSFYLLKRYD